VERVQNAKKPDNLDLRNFHIPAGKPGGVGEIQERAAVLVEKGASCWGRNNR